MSNDDKASIINKLTQTWYKKVDEIVKMINVYILKHTQKNVNVEAQFLLIDPNVLMTIRLIFGWSLPIKKKVLKFDTTISMQYDR